MNAYYARAIILSANSEGVLIIMKLSPKQHVVLVIHGVGDQPVGGTVEAFAKSFALSHGKNLRDSQQRVWLTEEHSIGSSTHSEFFPCHIQSVSVNSSSAPNQTHQFTFAEVYWGDLSHVASGMWGTFKGVFSLITGLPHIVRAAKRSNDGLATVYNAVQLVVRSVLAVNLFLAIVVSGVVGTAIYYGNVGEADSVSQYIAIVSGLVLFFVSAVFSQYFKERGNDFGRFLELFWWVVVFAVIWIAGHYWLVDPASGLEWIVKSALSILWLLWGLVTLVMLIGLIGFVVALFRRSYLAASTIVLLCTIANAFFWAFVIYTAWYVAFYNVFENYLVQGAENLLTQSLRFVAFLWFSLAVLLVTLLFIQWMRHWWTIARRRRKLSRRGDGILVNLVYLLSIGYRKFGQFVWQKKSSIPRMIIGWPIILSLIFLTIMWVVIYYFPKFDVFHGLNDLALILLGGLSAIGSTFLATIRPGIDIGLDVINWFRSDGTNRDYVCRRRMLERFFQVLNHITPATTGTHAKPQLWIVAHSQGTVLAMEALRDDGSKAAALFNRSVNSSAHVVTFGSPLTHLYQHYFPLRYTENGPQKNTIAKRVSKWLNIYYINDFVGTQLDALPVVVENQDIDDGFHTDYWSDRELYKKINQYFPF